MAFVPTRTLEEILKASKTDFETTYDRASLDFAYFSNIVIGRGWGQFHFEQASHVLVNRYACLLSPRGHWKTSVFSIDYPLWYAWRSKRSEVMKVSHTLPETRRSLFEIAEILRTNEFFKEYRPVNFKDGFSKDMIKGLANNSTIFTKPFNSKIRGPHPDLSIFDDILRNEEISQNRVKEIFWGDAWSCCDNGEAKVIGTPMAMDDLLMLDLRNPENGFSWKRYQAIITDETGKWLKTLWERKTLEEFELDLKRMGPHRFQREKMCNPRASQDSLFGAYIGMVHDEGKVVQARPNKSYYLGVDCALSENKTSDFTVLLVVEKDLSTGMLKVIYYERFRTSKQNEIMQRIEKLHNVYRFRRICIEKEGGATGIVNDLSDFAQHPAVSNIIEGIRTGGQSMQKWEIISNISVALSKGILLLLNDQILLDELKNYEDRYDPITDKLKLGSSIGHDDCVIALGMALEGVRMSIGGASLEVITDGPRTDNSTRNNGRGQSEVSSMWV